MAVADKMIDIIEEQLSVDKEKNKSLAHPLLMISVRIPLIWLN